MSTNTYAPIAYASLKEVLRAISLDEVPHYSYRSYTASLEGNEGDLREVMRLLRNEKFGSGWHLEERGGSHELVFSIRPEPEKDIERYNRLASMNISATLKRFSSNETVLTKEAVESLLENIGEAYSILKREGAGRDLLNECRQLMSDMKNYSRKGEGMITASMITGFMGKVSSNGYPVNALTQDVKKELSPSPAKGSGRFQA